MPPLLRPLILCACAAGGFAGMAVSLHWLAPLRVPQVTPKLDYLEAHLGEFDTVFIGSSRIYHGVSPKVFDAVMAAAGQPTHSFNLAVNGMMPPESLHMARTLLAMRPPRLRSVFLEVAAARGIAGLESPTVRDVYFQDPRELVYEWQRAWLDYRTAPRKFRWRWAWRDVSRSWTLFCRNELNIGRLIPTPDFAPNQPDTRGDVLLGPDLDGYVPERHPLTEAERAKLEKGIEAVRNGTAKARAKDPLTEASYAGIRDLLAKQGVELVLVMAAVTTRDYHAWVDAPPGVRLLAFDHPERYPELYSPEHRFDYDHLNDDGARIFSRELAEAYLAGK